MDTLLPLLLSLSHVVVYPTGALYRYTGIISARKGWTTFIWTELPPTTDPQSLRVSLSGSAKGFIAQTAIEPFTPQKMDLPEDVKYLRRKVDSLENLFSKAQNRLTILSLQEKTLSDNIQLGGEEGTTCPEEVERYLLLIEKKLSQILEERFSIERRRAVIAESLERYKKAYEARLGGLESQRAVLVMSYWAPEPEVVPIRVELSGPSASWSLTYRVRAFPGQGQVIFQRWAAVQNRSGEDWGPVQVTLSTAIPWLSSQMPPFSPWYVDIASPPQPTAERKAFLLQEEGAAEEKADANPVFLSEQTLSRTYEIGLQRIPAGERMARFLLKADTLSAIFRFFVNAPAEEAAYLRAGLKLESLFLWEKAPAVIEVDGTEVGHSVWPPSFSEDTVWLDMGKSAQVQVSRTEIQNRREERSFGTIHHLFEYKLRLTHTYPKPIPLTLWDHLPVSRHSDIKVEPIELGGALLEADKGLLRWELNLEPNQAWERSFRFVVKYPRQRPISGL
ncbi:MAG: mucoidy inhibitor MuiA family protein [Bacteroidia bacterium]|nr:mucoidy inhibitor MuiA family protein [Bacteroidia bacterium]MDW8014693.1 mucoidy inhibitor MuiA family protein [Bacteroidia bacterium]